MIDNFLINNLLKFTLKDKTQNLANKSFNAIYSFIDRANIENKDKILKQMTLNDQKLKKGLYYGLRAGEGIGLTSIGAPIYKDLSDAFGGLDKISQSYKNKFKS